MGSYLLDLEITKVKTVEVMKLDGGWMERLRWMSMEGGGGSHRLDGIPMR